MKKQRHSELNSELRQCADSLKESADNFKTAVESIDPVLGGLIDVVLERQDDAQLEAEPVSGTQRLLTVKEVAAYLRVNDRSVYLWVKHKNLPHRKVGNDLRFDLAEVDEWTRPKTKTLEKAPLHMVE